MKKLIPAFVLVLLLTLTACQPTPDKPIVVGKQGDPLTSQAAGTEQKPFEAPEHWKEDAPVTLEKLSVVVDADVAVPDVTAYPVIKVGNRQFTQEEADRFIDVLAQGKKLYPNIPSREELESLQLSLRAEYERLKAKEPNSIYLPIYESYIAKGDRYIAEQYNEEAYKNAKINTDIKRGSILLHVDFGKPMKSSLTIANADGLSNILCTSSLYFSLDTSNYTNYDKAANEVLSVNDTPVGVKMTREQAVAQGEEMLSKLGVTNMTLTQIAPVFSTFYGIQAIRDKQAWQLLYVPAVKGISVNLRRALGTDISNSIVGTNGNAPMYYNEVFTLVIDDEGMHFLTWQGAMELQDTVTESAKLLPFNEIQERIKEQLPRQYSDSNIKAAYPTNIVHVTKLELGLMRVRVKNAPDEYMLTPVWDVIGYTDVNNSTGAAKVDPQNHIITLLTLNAMDGSVVDRDSGN